jgi:hypothetical protein
MTFFLDFQDLLIADDIRMLGLYFFALLYA